LTGIAHRELVLDQFTRQASAFSAAAMITDETVLAMIVDHADAQPTDTVLDVACGPGLVVCAFAPRVHSATGIDFTPAMLDQARSLAAEKGLANVAWDRGDAYALPYPDRSFSIVVTRYSLHHLLDPQAALREMARVCAPGGRIVVVDAYASEDPAKAAAYHRVEVLRDPSHARSLSLDELRDLFSGAGLPQPRTTLYELPVGLDELLGRAFPNPGDLDEIRATFTAAAEDDRLGIPVHRRDGMIQIAYRAAILVAERSSR
jgi:ubiquinone/menaquinone biosynthesis C-methylase UbiE